MNKTLSKLLITEDQGKRDYSGDRVANEAEAI
jgi:hypothetical protein